MFVYIILYIIICVKLYLVSCCQTKENKRFGHAKLSCTIDSKLWVHYHVYTYNIITWLLANLIWSVVCSI